MDSKTHNDAPRKLADALLVDEEIAALPSAEWFAVTVWIGYGTSKHEALALIKTDLLDAAEEDGYDGP